MKIRDRVHFVASVAGLGLLIGAGIVLPGAAVAATGSTASTGSDASESVTFVAGDGQRNDLRVAQTYSVSGYDTIWHYRFDDVFPIAPGAGCTQPNDADATVVICDLFETADFTPTIAVDTGDQADRIEVHAAQENQIHAGPGDDLMIGASGDNLWGDAGADTIEGSRAHGGDGDDVIYHPTTGYGDAGNDILIGTAGGQMMSGGPGDDLMIGLGGRDYLYGDSGKDTILGGTGDDVLYGGPGEDSLYGNSGKDTLRGGPQQDTLSGGPGVNRLYQN